jgi:hypothetical protein
MADAPVVHIGENSPEYVAFRLMSMIRGLEDHKPPTRAAVLDLYAECREAVAGSRSPSGSGGWSQKKS